MSDVSLEEVLRKMSFLNHLVADIKNRYDGVGGACDGSVTDYRGAIWFSASDKDVEWDQLSEVMEEATRRLDDLGLQWIVNDAVQQKEWKSHPLTGDSSPYTGEIEIDGITEEVISKYETSYVDGSLSDEPRNADIFRQEYEKAQ